MKIHYRPLGPDSTTDAARVLKARCCTSVLKLLCFLLQQWAQPCLWLQQWKDHFLNPKVLNINLQRGGSCPSTPF
jgi:hypothetical protein